MISRNVTQNADIINPVEKSNNRQEVQALDKQRGGRFLNLLWGTAHLVSTTLAPKAKGRLFSFAQARVISHKTQRICHPTATSCAKLGKSDFHLSPSLAKIAMATFTV